MCEIGLRMRGHLHQQENGQKPPWTLTRKKKLPETGQNRPREIRPGASAEYKGLIETSPDFQCEVRPQGPRSTFTQKMRETTTRL